MRKKHVFTKLLFSLCVALYVPSTIGVTALTHRVEPKRAVESTAITLPHPYVESMRIADEASGIRVVSSDVKGIVLELVTPAFEVFPDTDGKGVCSLLHVDGYGSNVVSGSPELPLTGTMVGIPERVDVTLTVVDEESVTLPGYDNLCPVARPLVDERPGENLRYMGTERRRDVEAYATPTFSPATVAELYATGFIRSQRVAQVRFHPFQYDPVSGLLRHIHRIRVRLDFAPVRVGHETEGDNLLSVPGEQTYEGAFEEILANMVLNYEEARAWRLPPHQSSAMSSDPRVIQDDVNGAFDPQYKVTIDQDGIYQITYTDLQDAGIPVDTLDPRTLKLENLGDEVAIYVAGEADGHFDVGDYILFYGQQTRTKYTDVNAYWLYWGGNAGERMATLDGMPSGTAMVPAHFQTTQRVEEDHVYQSARPSGPDNDHWYWQFIWTTAPTVASYTTTLTYPASAPLSATISGIFKGYDATPIHHTRVYLNGHLVDDATWLPEAEYVFEETVPQSYLISGTNTISVAVPLDNGITGDYFVINRFDITYHKSYAATGDALTFAGDTPGDWEYNVDGFTDSAIESFDITVPTAPVRILNGEITSVGGRYRFSFEHSIATQHLYMALNEVIRKHPLSIVPVVPSDLRSTANGADYIIISHSDFITVVQPLVNDYLSQGLRTMVVNVQDVYDVFGYGIFDPVAIQSFLAYAYANWLSPAPSYVLLVGDGNYDFKNYLRRNEPNYIPPYLSDVDPWMGEAAADNRYVAVSGGDILPDMHLGRLAVKSITEVAAIVDKIQSYKQQAHNAGGDAKTLFVTDNPDAAGDFYQYSDAIANNYILYPYTVQKVYYGQTHTTAASAKADIIAAINEGRLLINFIGHAGVNFWASEMLLATTDVPSLNNPDKYPFVTPMTCLEGNYIHPSPASLDISALSEVLLRTPNKGAIASFSPTGLGVTSGHDVMNKALYKAIFQDDIVELGAATMLGKLALAGIGHDELIDTYLLFGDPALHLNVLQTDVSITKSVMPRGALYPGDTVTYTLAYTNTGPATAHHVVISDTLPLGVSAPVVTSSGAPITARVGSAFVWDVADLMAGQGGTITVTGMIAPPLTTTLTNAATIQTSAVETDTTNNTTPPVVNPVLAPDLVITKQGPTQGKPDRAITYTLAYTNTGTVLAHQVIISDVLPSSLLTPTFTFSGAPIVPQPDTAFVWDAGDLAPGEGGLITISGTISPTFFGVITNTASIATPDVEYTLDNNVTDPVLTGVNVTDLAIAKSGPTTAYPGGLIAYTLTYTNVGDVVVPYVTVVDHLPSAVQLYDHSGTVTQPHPDDQLTWEVFDLAPGAGGTITVSVTISPSFTGWMTNTATIASSLPEFDLTGNESFVETHVVLRTVYLPLVMRAYP